MTWKTKQGYYIEIEDMTDDHIKNCLKSLNCRTKFGRYWNEVFTSELERREEEKNKIRLTINGNINNPHIVLSLSRMPENCYECPIQSSYEEDEYAWGDGIHYYCPYGGKGWGSAVQIPEDCPLIGGKNG